MRQAEFSKLWLMYREAFMSCLLACGGRADGGGSPAAVARLKRLSEELFALQGAICLSQPDRVLHFQHGLDEVGVAPATLSR